MEQQAALPSEFRRVTEDEFYKALYADSRDIMPVISHSPHYTLWETKSREVWGWSTGWKREFGQEKIYGLKN